MISAPFTENSALFRGILQCVHSGIRDWVPPSAFVVWNLDREYRYLPDTCPDKGEDEEEKKGKEEDEEARLRTNDRE